ncbi:MAG TPA: hypothetical protein VGO11_19615 [Chthoniobacteraceae bacterium]|jgi:hypothetical protein|nr:hypothetical protein [Chthoniobacteraceae bacterium]
MAFNPAPSHWIPNEAVSGSDLVIPIASFPELTSGEAHATTGDIRKLAYAITKKLYDAQQAESAADRPAKMQITKGQSLSADGTTMTVTHQFTYVLAISSADVAAE